MKKIVAVFALCLILAASPALGHHPAADVAPEDVYAMIDELVSDTPHATMVFDTMGSETTITAPSVSAAEDMIDDYLLAVLSLLPEDITVTITFGEDLEIEAAVNSAQADKWTERNDWGRQVIITIDTLLCNPQTPDGCQDITEN